MLLGAIADDLTGATDLCLTLAREGMRTVQIIGVPPQSFDFGDADAVVIALKSRTIPAAEAVSLSLAAADRLVAAGAEQIMFKYCSTFDSTPQGNIGQVTEALLDHLDVPTTIACPAFPANGRTVYQGYLFVGGMLLSESPMKDHPLTPMRDANLVRVLQRQTALPVGRVTHDVVDRDAGAIADAIEACAGKGDRIVIVDALNDEHLRAIGQAVAGMRLITGGSGIAVGLPANFRSAGKLTSESSGQGFEATPGRAVILAGSCSSATRQQIDMAMACGIPALNIDPLDIARKTTTAEQVMDWLIASPHPTPIVYSSAHPDAVRAAQDELGREQAGTLVEHLLAQVAVGLYDAGFTRFIVAGGETSGAVVQALGVTGLRIGPEIDPGVPWTISIANDRANDRTGDRQVTLALKSGNFGSADFLIKAWDLLR